MKQLVKDIILGWHILLAKIARLFSSPDQVVVICPPFPNDINIGDRGLVLGALTELYKQDKNITLVQMTDSHVPAFAECPDILITDEYVPMFKVHKDLRASKQWIRFLRKAKRVFLIGADSIDEYYSPSDSRAKLFAAGLAGKIGIRTNVMSFSINEVTPGLKNTMNAFPNEVQLVARDPVSFERLKAQNIAKIHCSADLSFLFGPSTVREDADLQAFLANNQNQVIGFSFNNLLFDADADNSASFDFYAEAIHQLLQSTKMKALFIPNNVRDSTKYSAEIHQRLEQKAPGQAFLSEYLGDCAELKALMAHCRYYFSTTLHMGLFPIGVGVPTTCFPYAGKFDGPFGYFDILDSQIKIEDIPQEPEAFANIMLTHVEKADERKQKIAQNIDKVLGFAKLNLADLP